MSEPRVVYVVVEVDRAEPAFVDFRSLRCAFEGGGAEAAAEAECKAIVKENLTQTSFEVHEVSLAYAPSPRVYTVELGPCFGYLQSFDVLKDGDMACLYTMDLRDESVFPNSVWDFAALPKEHAPELRRLVKEALGHD